MADLQWMSSGGLLLDGTGDIALTTSDYQDLQSIITTYLKANSTSWQLYNIGANLSSIPGTVNESEAEAAAIKQIQSTLNSLLPRSAYTIQTVKVGSQIDIYLYIQNTLVATTSINSTGVA